MEISDENRITNNPVLHRCHTDSRVRDSVVGSYHKVSEKHLDAYLDEFEWRFNNRKNPYLFRDTILKLITSSNLEYKKLTSAA